MNKVKFYLSLSNGALSLSNGAPGQNKETLMGIRIVEGGEFNAITRI